MPAPQAPYIGDKKGKLALDEAIFGEPFHGPLVHETVRAELASRRRGTASTKRGEVAMTGAKAWRQKGTGRARAGALSVPHRTGGGVAFGPRRGCYPKVNRKARRRALRAACRCTPSAVRSRLSTGGVGVAVHEVRGRGAGRPRATDRCRSCSRGRRRACARSFGNIAGVSVLAADDVAAWSTSSAPPW